MYSGFSLSALQFPEDQIDHFYQVGLNNFKQCKVNVSTNLKKYICEKGIINGTMMQEDWFPQVSADVFLSHSHKDEKDVIVLAGWLNECFDLRVFVDSCIWGYAPDLLKIIDDEYCVSNEENGHVTYSYQKRNYSTSHVYMMLSVALAKMIDKSECLIFYNTPLSLTTSSTISKGSTNSPWIYHELQTSKLIRHRSLRDYRKVQFRKDEYGAILEHAQLNISYDVTLDHLVNIDADDLNSWKTAYSAKHCEYPLDKLYLQKGLFNL